MTANTANESTGRHEFRQALSLEEIDHDQPELARATADVVLCIRLDD
jgi:hypothetical protein